MSDVTGRIFNIETFGTVDGPGVRFVFFLQGCLLRCIFCHNPEAFHIMGSHEITVEDALAQVLKYKSYIRDGGVTFSGGEPLLQAPFVLELTKRLHEYDIHVAIDTAGSPPLEMVKEAVTEADLILLDIKALQPELFKIMTTRDNKNAFILLDYLEKISKPTWIRHVLVPGFTLKEEPLKELAFYVSQFKCVECVELIPFHKLGEYKWEDLPEEYILKDVPTPEPYEVEFAKTIFREAGYTKKLL
ncbi:MAG: pyruvate formate lyase-activating protein [Clostridiales Family XIII bacterium]|jgi:pyruvate formate lyase activating enzyme|nr:pyruvate formate lyase-activating protein [Clostridiales Family XIII bacterium]